MHAVGRPAQSKRGNGISYLISNGVYFNVGANVLGPIEFKMGKKEVDILWILQITCMCTGAISFAMMEEYSPAAFLSAFETHGRRYKYPAHVTTNSVSPLKRGLKRLTRSGVCIACNKTLVGELEYLLKDVQNVFRSLEFYVADSNSQAVNALSEGNTKAAKQILKSLIDSIQQNSKPFSSLIKVISTFERIGSLLNSRPIFHNETSIMSVKHLMFPTTGISEKEDTLIIPLPSKNSDVHSTMDEGILRIISESDQTYLEFAKLFTQAVQDSSYQRFGKKVTRKQNKFQDGDFILVLVNVGAKYGIVHKIISPHTISVQLLNRNRKIKTLTRVEEFAAEQCTLLYRKPNLA